MTVRAEIYNHQRSIRLDVPRLRELLSRAVTECVPFFGRGTARLTALEAVEVTVVSDRRIASLHRRFLNISGPTDVITFDHGEIIVSATTAAERCISESETLDREVARYVVHGLLHLNGHLDQHADEAAAMWIAQEAVLASLWPQDDRVRTPQRPGMASNR